MEVSALLADAKPRQAGRSYVLLGDIYAATGQPERARELYELGIEKLQAHPDRYLVEAYSKLASLLEDQGEPTPPCGAQAGDGRPRLRRRRLTSHRTRACRARRVSHTLPPANERGRGMNGRSGEHRRRVGPGRVVLALALCWRSRRRSPARPTGPSSSALAPAQRRDPERPGGPERRHPRARVRQEDLRADRTVQTKAGGRWATSVRPRIFTTYVATTTGSLTSQIDVHVSPRLDLDLRRGILSVSARTLNTLRGHYVLRAGAPPRRRVARRPQDRARPRRAERQTSRSRRRRDAARSGCSCPRARRATATTAASAASSCSATPRSLRARDRRAPAVLGDLPLTIDGYSLERLEQRVSSEFTRVTTVVHLRGGGEEGVGEDVTYGADDQQALQDAGPGARPQRPGGRSATSASSPAGSTSSPRRPNVPGLPALPPLGLRERGARPRAPPGGRLAWPIALGLEAQPGPLRRLDAAGRARPPSEPVLRRLAQYPWLEFKLDATSSWTDELVAELAATGAVESIDLKGRYVGHDGRPARRPRPLPARRRGLPGCVDRGPGADARDRGGARAVLGPRHLGRADPLDRRPRGAEHQPRGVNLKPSRIGSIAALLETYDYCPPTTSSRTAAASSSSARAAARSSTSPRSSTPPAPNDVAPRPFNEAELRPGLPESPLAAGSSPTGFRWGD